MRLIDADNLKEGIACHKQWTDQEYETDRQWAVGYNAGIERALFSITYARTIDAVPVVRCKDCEHWDRDWEPSGNKAGVHFCQMLGLVTEPDFYCKHGERRRDHDD